MLEHFLDGVRRLELLAVHPDALSHEERVIVDMLLLDDVQALQQVIMTELDIVIIELPELVEIALGLECQLGRLMVVKEKLPREPDSSGPLTLLMTRVRQPIVATALL